jgi:hypothetical protein
MIEGPAHRAHSPSAARNRTVKNVGRKRNRPDDQRNRRGATISSRHENDKWRDEKQPQSGQRIRHDERLTPLYQSDKLSTARFADFS